MIYLKWFFLIFCFLGSQKANACNRGEHHSVMHHYNSAQTVFKGKVLWVGRSERKKESFVDIATQIRGFFVQFEVIEAYKNCHKGQQICVGVLPAVLTGFEAASNYLIYASEDRNYSFLTTETSCSSNDSLGIQQQQLIFEISKQHSGYVTEMSTLGKLWAEGKLLNGLAEGLWKYYALSGELQIAGLYSKGIAVGKWQTFYHTRDQNYMIFQAIQAGDLTQQSSAYHFIRLDSSKSATFRFRITYAVDKDSIQESYYYNKALLSKEVEYAKGLKEGKELSYDRHGNICKEYHFENDQLEGDFWLLQYDQLDPRNYIKIMGTYKADHKITEKHLFYQNKELIKVVSVLNRNRFQK